MTGSLVISLDFELMWGVRDRRSVRDYGDAVLGGRQAIPLMLDRFQAAGIRATWATVGLLFAKTRTEMLDYAPRVRPAYYNSALSPYPDIENKLIGENEADDPLHFGASLIDRIVQVPGQEIATHTYSHFYCLEPGATLVAFADDMESTIAIAHQEGHRLQSIVFPRNQSARQFIAQSRAAGLSVYRGEAAGWLYRPRADLDTTKLFRLARFLDGALPIGPRQVVWPVQCGGSQNVPASRFLRPWTKKLAPYHELHMRRIESEMRTAARRGGCYHLWWHPHNFGRNMERNLAQLDRVISCFEHCRYEFGMVSRTMQDLAT
jgi:hypothetical protein